MGRILRNAILGAIIAGTYLGISLEGRKNNKERQEYNTLAHQAVECTDNDGIEGHSFDELKELYRKAGVRLDLVEPSFGVDFLTGVIVPIGGAYKEVPKLTKQDLQRVVESCD